MIFYRLRNILRYCPEANMASPTIDEFLEEVRGLLRDKNGIKLQDVMLLEPPLPPSYHRLVSELKQSFPEHSEDALLTKCASFLPEYDADYDEKDGGGSSPAFATFAVRYFAFLRDVDVDDLVETHDLLKNLLKFLRYPGFKLVNGACSVTHSNLIF